MVTVLKFNRETISLNECFRLLNVTEEDQEGYVLQPNLITIEYVSENSK